MQQAALFRRERQFVVGVVLWFVCDYQRNLRENRPFKHIRTEQANNKEIVSVPN
jgi:hypothetical protein